MTNTTLKNIFLYLLLVLLLNTGLVFGFGFSAMELMPVDLIVTVFYWIEARK